MENIWQRTYNLKCSKEEKANKIKKKGIVLPDDAYNYLLNKFSACCYDVGSELMMYDYNIHAYHIHIKYNNELKNFIHPDRLKPIYNSIVNMASDKEIINALNIINCKVTVNEVMDRLNKLVFYNLPKAAGFTFNVLDYSYSDYESFVLSVVKKSDLNDIFKTNAAKERWKKRIYKATNDIVKTNVVELLNNIK